MLTIEALVTAVFVMVLIGASIATADTARSEQRLRRLERGDPATADAVRRAQAIADYARGGFFGLDAVALICTPSRRSLHVGGDLEELEPSSETRPDVATTAPVVRALHAEPPSDAAAPVGSGDRRDAASARLSRRAVRTARATRRRPEGIR
jgi:hypothetical protein